jgi:tetratricopeptide (TPR) repeat protein
VKRAAVGVSALALMLVAIGASAQPQATPTTTAPESGLPDSRGAGMATYQQALAARKLGSTLQMSLDDVKTRAAEGEDLLRNGRIDECVSRMLDLVESPQFTPFVNDEAGRAAIFLLGDAYARAGAYQPARAYFRKLLDQQGAWEGVATYARRAVRRLVEVGIESERYDAALDDVKLVPQSAPEETRGEIAYLRGRAAEAKHDPDGALVAYAAVTPRSRFWAQATYLQGLILVEKKQYKEGENMFCKVADPQRASSSTPVYADERFFAVRDLARLGLGRVAHEQFRFDDSRYYYYLVPRDSDRLAEALYEAATSRYEKKDYEGARELLDELKGLQIHHPYEDEAWILDAYIDLAQCKFKPADDKLLKFVALYEPVRDAARRVQGDERSMNNLLEAARQGGDAGNTEAGAALKPEALRAIAALVRIDPAYGTVVRQRAVLDHEASGLRLTMGSLNDIRQQLATTGGVRPAQDDKPTDDERAKDAKDAADGVRRMISDLEGNGASASQLQPLKEELNQIQTRVNAAKTATTTAAANAVTQTGGKDLPDLIRADEQTASTYLQPIETARAELSKTESALAKDTLRRVDLRLSRLLRRARLGRIESVLGRKRSLEIEIEAINNGFLPQDAVDALDAARFLKDSEEYWPFEGDDWPDEFIGSEGLK